MTGQEMKPSYLTITEIVRQEGNTTALSSSIQSWQAAIDYGSFQGEVEIPALSSEEDEEEIRWYLDDYAVYDPLQIACASEALKVLIHDGQRLAQTIDLSGLTSMRRLSEILVEAQVNPIKSIGRCSSNIHLDKDLILHWR